MQSSCAVSNLDGSEGLTTKKEFDRFVAECERLQVVLNLQDWKLYFKHRKIDQGKNAQVILGSAARVAVLEFNKIQYDPDKDESSPEESAKHEMAHVFTATLEHLASSRYVTESEINLEMERLAIVLEKVL